MEVPGGLLVQGQEPPPAAAGGFVHIPFGEFQIGPLGQQTQGVQVGQVFHLHHEGDNPTALAAAKAVVELPVRDHMEGGGLFSVEGTQAPIAAALLGQPDVVGNHVHNI